MTITSSPPGATVEIWPTDIRTTTPAEVSLARRGTYAIRYQLDGHHEESVQVSHVTSEVVAFDVLVGGFVGLIVDFTTGAGYRLVPNPVHANLAMLDKAARLPRMVVRIPSDARGDRPPRTVAGTSWESCDSDSIYGEAAADFVQGRLAAELRDSGLFQEVSMEDAELHDLVMESELDVFCSHAFLYYRVAGLSALRVTVRRDGQVVFRAQVERVVTDADKEYTGQQAAGTIEQARRSAMADSLHKAIEDLVARLRSDLPRAISPGTNAGRLRSLDAQVRSQPHVLLPADRLTPLRAARAWGCGGRSGTRRSGACAGTSSAGA